MTFEVIATGSTGNAVLIDDRVLIDCGVPWKKLQPYADRLQLVLLTHWHSDHFHSNTVATLARNRPTLRWGCCRWMLPILSDTGVSKRQIDVMEPGSAKVYATSLVVRPERLTHNVPNCGYHIFVQSFQTGDYEKLFYATDTCTLSGIEARGYDLYLIEANHRRDEIRERIAAKRAAGEYAYEIEAARNHLSREQAEDWLYSQIGPKSMYAFLHQHMEKRETKC